jgi:hypothetical protein
MGEHDHTDNAAPETDSDFLRALTAGLENIGKGKPVPLFGITDGPVPDEVKAAVPQPPADEAK